MILWRRTIGVSLALLAASSLCTVAQAAPAQEEGVDTPLLTQVDDLQLDEMLADDLSEGETIAEPVTEAMPIAAEDPAAIAADEALAVETVADEALAAQVTPVPTEVLENLSQTQLEAIATIITTAEETANTAIVANLPAEVLTHLDALPIVQQQVGRRRWLPTSLVRRLRLPQMIASLVRQPKNTALVMLGNHIVVVNPVTGAVLGAVLSAL